MEPFFKNLGSELLAHPGPTGTAVISTAVKFPAVLVGLPGLAALVDKILLVLFGLLAMVSWCLVMYVVRLVFVDLSEPLSGMLVDQCMILVNCVLPFSLPLVMEVVGAFIRDKSCVPLSSSQLRFIAWSIWGFGVAGDIQDRDPTSVLIGTKSWNWRRLCCLRQASQTEANWTMTLTGTVVYLAKATSPAKRALAFVCEPGGMSWPRLRVWTQRPGHTWRGGIKGKGPTTVLVLLQRLEGLPAAMALVRMGILSVFLWFEWYPSSRPKRFFFWARDPLHPLSWHWVMLSVLVPLAKPQNVFGGEPERAGFDLGGVSVLDSSLNPSPQVGLLWCREFLAELFVDMPVQSGDQVLVIGPAADAASALLMRCLK